MRPATKITTICVALLYVASTLFCCCFLPQEGEVAVNYTVKSCCQHSQEAPDTDQDADPAGDCDCHSAKVHILTANNSEVQDLRVPVIAIIYDPHDVNFTINSDIRTYGQDHFSSFIPAPDLRYSVSRRGPPVV